MTDKTIIKCEHVSKIFEIRKSTENNFFKSLFSKSDYFQALDDISFEIYKGEAIGIIGKNGAGKSTLLKILSKITYPSNGNIFIGGRLTALLEVGTGFHPELTGRENIYLNGALLGMNRHEINSKMDEIIDFSGVEKFIDLPVKNYSSGMYVRLGFSVAAHLNSDIILLDEVLAVGDAEFQNKCKNKMLDFKNSDTTILLVSHDLELIKSFTDKTMVLDSGKLSYFGNTNEACNHFMSTTNSKFGKVIKHGEVKYKSGIIEVEIDYEFDYQPNEVNLGIVILNAQFQPLTGTNVSFEKNYKQGKLTNDRKGKIFAKSAFINLANGTYYISLWMSDLNNELDRLDFVLSFVVNDSIKVINNTGSIRTAFDFNNPPSFDV